MKKIIFPSPFKVQLKDEEIPKVKNKSLLVKTLYSGISNGTERNMLSGESYSSGFPISPGYQIVGKVEKCGKDVQDFLTGENVFCGNSRGHSEYIVINENKLVFTLPPKQNLRKYSLSGLVAAANHAFKKGDVSSSKNVGVIGSGMIGQFVAQYCLNQGAKVSIVDPDKSKLKITTNPRLINTFKDYSSLEECDILFECSGKNKLNGFLEKKILNRGSKLILIGGRENIFYNFNSGQKKEISLIHTDHFDRIDLREAINSITTEEITVLPLIEGTYPISKFQEIYKKLMKNSPLGLIFDWSE